MVHRISRSEQGIGRTRAGRSSSIIVTALPTRPRPGIGVEGRDEPAHVGGFRDVVGVEPGDDLAARGGDAAVGRGGGTDL